MGVGSSAFCCESSQRIGEIIEMMDSRDGAADAMQELRGTGKWWYQCLANVCVYSLEGGHRRCWWELLRGRAVQHGLTLLRVTSHLESRG